MHYVSESCITERCLKIKEWRSTRFLHSGSIRNSSSFDFIISLEKLVTVPLASEPYLMPLQLKGEQNNENNRELLVIAVSG